MFMCYFLRNCTIYWHKIVFFPLICKNAVRGSRLQCRREMKIIKFSIILEKYVSAMIKFECTAIKLMPRKFYKGRSESIARDFSFHVIMKTLT